MQGERIRMKTIINVILYEEEGSSIRGFASLMFLDEEDGSFVMNNVLIRERGNKLCVSIPSQKNENDLGFPLTKKLKDEIRELVLEEYKKRLKERNKK